ncbi:MAG: ChbG/HpnK family deacetylase [Bacteroidales bacterium]|nr:ChbG/HpnK family deacetylase [Bacteroidales bacterium]
MAKIIINADDFGLSNSVNDAIIAAFEKGLITNTTLMVNMPGTEDAVKRAKELGLWNRVGLHINLYEGEPLNSSLKRFNQVLRKDNTLTYWTRGKSRFYLNNELSKELRKEMELQVNRFISFKPICMHADSHGHSHTNYSIWRVYKNILKSNGFISTRLSRNLYTSRTGNIRELCKNIYKNLYNRDVTRTFQFNTDYFGSFSDFKSVMDSRCIQFGDDSIVELMCHPVYEAGELVNKGNLGFSEILEHAKLFTIINF